VVQTVTNPASQTSVGESFNAVGGCTNYCETFTVGANCTLQTISIYAGGGTGTGGGTNLLLAIIRFRHANRPESIPLQSGK
jgi:hypothetical protein